MHGWHFLVDRSDIRRTSVVEIEPEPLDDGDVRLRVDSFGFTANNVTYAAVGDMIGYWQFFPAPPTDDGTNWGRVPVWGFADVAESLHADVSEGERLFGYLPMSTELVIRPGRVTGTSVTDASPHRAELPATYNRLSRCAADPGHDPEQEDMQMIYRPLFLTSFLIDDFLDDNQRFGADTVVLTSASSKTAFGTAHLLHDRGGVRVVGLTSPGNVDFVEALGSYDQVLSYEQIAELEQDPAVLLDFSGNATVVRSVHERLGDRLVHSSVIGVTHWEDRAGEATPLPGPPQTFFFAPTQVEKRASEWGATELDRRLAAAWRPFIEQATDWVDVAHGHGPDDIARVYTEVMEGRTSPTIAHVLHP